MLAATLLASGCDRFTSREQSAKGNAPAAPARVANSAVVVTPARGGRTDPAPVAGTVSRIVDSTDIEVAGKPACALTVRYAGAVDQPATWRGEACTALTVRFVTLGDLGAIGQTGKLDTSAREAVGQLPGGKVLYVEGANASAIFAPNEAGLLVRTDLAD